MARGRNREPKENSRPEQSRNYLRTVTKLLVTVNAGNWCTFSLQPQIPCAGNFAGKKFPQKKISSSDPHKHWRFVIDQGTCRELAGNLVVSPCASESCIPIPAMVQSCPGSLAANPVLDCGYASLFVDFIGPCDCSSAATRTAASQLLSSFTITAYADATLYPFSPSFPELRLCAKRPKWNQAHRPPRCSATRHRSWTHRPAR